MAILSLDTYLANTIEQTLKVILPNCYIIDRILKDFDSEVRDNFKDTYCGKNPKKLLNVGYTFPQNPIDLDGSYVVQLSTATESGGSLGNNQGTYEESNGDEFTGVFSAQYDSDRNELYYEFDTELYEKPYSPEVQFADMDKDYVEGNRYYFLYETNEHLLGKPKFFHYVEKIGDSKGLVKGFNSNETVVVVGISNNVDTARCLDAILKMVFITSRETLEEQNQAQLQQLSFGDMSPIYEQGEKPIFGRPVTISYQVTHTIDYDIVEEIDELIFRERVDYNGKKINTEKS